MFEVCTLSDSLVSGVCSSAAHCVRKSIYCESLNCETDFLFGGQVCTVRELSDLLSRLPWAAKHVFDRNESKRNDARAIVDALYLRTLHDKYSVSKSEEIYVVRNILDAALLADYRDQYRGVDRAIVWNIEAAWYDADARVRQFWFKLDAKSKYASCDHYNEWCFKHPRCQELWYALDDAYNVYGYDEDANRKAREMLVRFGLIDNVSDLPDEETLLRRARVYWDGNYTACAGERCLASRDRHECRSSVNECAYSGCNSEAYHVTWINVDCDNYPKAVDHDARRHVFDSPASPAWCDTDSLPLRKPRAGVRLEEYTWSRNYGWLRNACRHFDLSTCQTPAEGRRERRRELRNARRREERYLRKQKATVYRGEQDVATMLGAYEDRWSALQRYYLHAEKRWQHNPIDRFRARADRALANLQAAGGALLTLRLSLAKLNRCSLERVC